MIPSPVLLKRGFSLACLIPLLSFTSAQAERAFESFEYVQTANGNGPIEKLNVGAGEVANPNSDEFTVGPGGQLYITRNVGPSGEALWSFHPTNIYLYTQLFLDQSVLQSQVDDVNTTSRLILGSDGNFYGQSGYGGAENTGFIFVITNSVEEPAVTVLKEFGADYPNITEEKLIGKLVEGAPGYFYGITPFGGTSSDGTVFSISATGVFTHLHSFNGANGSRPSEPMVFDSSSGTLYGTTPTGGANNAGTVFKITTNGVFTVLHSFSSATDGNTPGGLVRGSDGNIYGTTAFGGGNGGGTFFKITPGDTFVKITDFNAAFGVGDLIVRAAPVELTNGNFYAIAASTDFYEVTPGGAVTVITNIASVFSAIAEVPLPVNGLAKGPNDSIYGLTLSGHIFRYFHVSAPIIQAWSEEDDFTDPELLETNWMSATSSVGPHWWVKADGGNLTYQWQKDGVNLTNGGRFAGMNTHTPYITNLVGGDTGTYSVIVSNSLGWTNLTFLHLVVNDPAFFVGPANKVVSYGQTATFSAEARGTGPITYQWKRSGTNLIDGGNISGATTASLTIANVTQSDVETYTVVASNLISNATASAILTVSDPGLITQLQGQIVAVGSNAVFSISAIGTGTLNYQWRKGNFSTSTALVDGADVVGAQTASVTLLNTDMSDAGTYFVVITNEVGSIHSALGDLVVRHPPVITVQPVGATNTVGGNVGFSVTATGQFLTYQWKRNGMALNNSCGLNLHGRTTCGVTTATLTMTVITAEAEGEYTVEVSNGAGIVTSTPVYLTIPSTPQITGQPAVRTNNAGTAATFSVSATGGALAYQWKKAGTPLSNGGRISGATSSTLTITSVVGGDAANYTVTITNITGSITSDPAGLTVIDPYISIQPVGQTVASGNAINLSVGASGTASTYQWRTNGSNLPGATGSVYIKSPAFTIDSHDYTVVVTSTYGSVTSAVATVLVDSSITILQQPAGQINKVVGQNASFSVTTTGSNLKYQWKLDSNPIPGATNSIYALHPIPTSHVGSHNISVVISNALFSATSVNVPLVVAADTQIPSPPTILVPGANLSYKNDTYTMNINGKAMDNIRVENVFISLNNATFVPATLNTNGPSVTWTASITTSPGTNILRAHTVDYTGQTSAPVTVKFYDNHWSPFTLVIDSDPPVSADWFMIQCVTNTLGTNNGLNPLLVGRSYKLTVKQNYTNGYIFTNWSFTSPTNLSKVVLQTYTNANSLVLNYEMRSNMTLYVNFVTNQFRIRQGSYNGLFAETTETKQKSAGFINLSVTQKGQVSGKLLVDGDQVNFSGGLQIDGSGTFVGKRYTPFSKSDLSIALSFDIDGDRVTGSVIDLTNGWSSPVIADRNVWGKGWDGTVRIPTDYTNAYAWVLPGFATTNDGPTGWSSATMSVKTNGAVKTVVTTADGQLFTQNTSLSTNGEVPFYAPFYKDRNATNLAGTTITRSRGHMIGWLLLTNNLTPVAENYAPTGQVTWIKTAWTNTSWTAGFTNDAVTGVPIIGSVHKPSLIPIYSTLPDTNFLAVMSEGALVVGSFTNEFFLKSPLYNAFGTKTVNHKFSITLTRSTGVVGGSFTNDVTPISTLKWSGVMLQDYNEGYGYFMNTRPGITNGGGKVTIELKP